MNLLQKQVDVFKMASAYMEMALRWGNIHYNDKKALAVQLCNLSHKEHKIWLIRQR